MNKYILISESEDENSTLIAYCKDVYQVKSTIEDWILDGRDANQMTVVKASKISKVKIKLTRQSIII